MAKIGTVERELFRKLVADYCPTCKKVTEFDFVINQGAFVIGLPLFPSEKTTKITCLTCKNTIHINRAPKFLSAAHREYMPQMKTPKWVYSGSVIFGALLLIALIVIPLQNRKYKEYIREPHVGDVYSLKYEDRGSFFNRDKYTLIKVVSSTGEDITFSKALYEATSTDKLAEIKRMPDDEVWLDEEVTYTKEELLKMLEFDAPVQISDIDRE